MGEVSYNLRDRLPPAVAVDMISTELLLEPASPRFVIAVALPAPHRGAR